MRSLGTLAGKLVPGQVVPCSDASHLDRLRAPSGKTTFPVRARAEEKRRPGRGRGRLPRKFLFFAEADVSSSQPRPAPRTSKRSDTGPSNRQAPAC